MNNINEMFFIYGGKTHFLISPLFAESLVNAGHCVMWGGTNERHSADCKFVLFPGFSNGQKFSEILSSNFLCCKRVSHINEALYHCVFSVFIVIFSISGLFLLSLCYEFHLRSLFDFQAFLHINSLVLLLQLFTFIMTQKATQQS